MILMIIWTTEMDTMGQGEEQGLNVNHHHREMGYDGIHMELGLAGWFSVTKWNELDARGVHSKAKRSFFLYKRDDVAALLHHR